MPVPLPLLPLLASAMPRGREDGLQRPTMSQLALEDDRWRGPTPKAATGVIGLRPIPGDDDGDDMVDTRAAAAVAAAAAVSSGLRLLARPCALFCPIRRFRAVLAAAAEVEAAVVVVVVVVVVVAVVGGGSTRCLCPCRRRRRSWSTSKGDEGGGGSSSISCATKDESGGAPAHELMLVWYEN